MVQDGRVILQSDELVLIPGWQFLINFHLLLDQPQFIDPAALNELLVLAQISCRLLLLLLVEGIQ
jgi:hypothetical protein